MEKKNLKGDKNVKKKKRNGAVASIKPRVPSSQGNRARLGHW